LHLLIPPPPPPVPAFRNVKHSSLEPSTVLSWQRRERAGKPATHRSQVTALFSPGRDCCAFPTPVTWTWSIFNKTNRWDYTTLRLFPGTNIRGSQGFPKIRVFPCVLWEFQASVCQALWLPCERCLSVALTRSSVGLIQRLGCAERGCILSRQAWGWGWGQKQDSAQVSSLLEWVMRDVAGHLSHGGPSLCVH
jgi:hypothetical protein